LRVLPCDPEHRTADAVTSHARQTHALLAQARANTRSQRSKHPRDMAVPEDMAGAGETEITDPDRTPGPVVPVNGSLGDLIDLSMDDSDDETYATAANALNGSEEVLAAAEITDPVDDMAVPEDMAGAGETEITDPDRTPGPVVPVNGSLGDLIDLSMDDSDDETYATAANALNGSEEVLAAAEITDPVDDMAVPEDRTHGRL
ncbi:hypothetical protein PC122_g19965, partial [Phytophthora cactorum]